MGHLLGCDDDLSSHKLESVSQADIIHFMTVCRHKFVIACLLKTMLLRQSRWWNPSSISLANNSASPWGELCVKGVLIITFLFVTTHGIITVAGMRMLGDAAASHLRLAPPAASIIQHHHLHPNRHLHHLASLGNSISSISQSQNLLLPLNLNIPPDTNSCTESYNLVEFNYVFQKM